MPRNHCSKNRSRLVLLISFFTTLCRLPSAAQMVPSDRIESTPSSSSAAGADYEMPSLPDAPSTKATTYARTASAAANGYLFPTPQDRRKAYRMDLLGPGAFFAALFQSASDQAQSLKVGYPHDGYATAGEHPAHGAVPDWGEGFDGYTKRYASRFGMGLVGTTSRYGLGELLREDVSYHPCQCVGVLPRAYHAITQSLVARTRGGTSIPSLPAVASPFIAAEVATAAWYPARYNASDALRASTALYYGLAIKNLVKEFEEH